MQLLLNNALLSVQMQIIVLCHTMCARIGRSFFALQTNCAKNGYEKVSGEII